VRTYKSPENAEKGFSEEEVNFIPFRLTEGGEEARGSAGFTITGLLQSAGFLG
jgi:hypothetical protein